MHGANVRSSRTVSLAINESDSTNDRPNRALNNKAIAERSCVLPTTVVTVADAVGGDGSTLREKDRALDLEGSEGGMPMSNQFSGSPKNILEDQFDCFSISMDRDQATSIGEEVGRAETIQYIDTESESRFDIASLKKSDPKISQHLLLEQEAPSDDVDMPESYMNEEITIGFSNLSAINDLHESDGEKQLNDKQSAGDGKNALEMCHPLMLYKVVRDSRLLTDEPNLDKSLPFDQLPSATADAMETYENISSNNYLGSATGNSIAEESMPCDCKYDPDVDDPNAACGDDNFCINRMMFMECMVDDCSCGRFCRNRRFQLRQYARVDVIKTDKKGYGLRALTDLPSNAFIMEYVGEVIPNCEFIQRTRNYEMEGLKHYYFMTLKTDEIIDATKKGCLARFINHSCNPNSVTQKWVVGKKMRIGIFTTRSIQAGEELTFDYKFERYGAVAQKCYCGETNCKGYIGAADKSTEEELVDTPSFLSDGEADLDSVDTTASVVPKPRKNRRTMTRPLADPDEVQSFVKNMLDSVGKAPLVNKLLHRLELTSPNTMRGKEILKTFIRLHGLKMLKFWLGEWKNDNEIVMKVLHVLERLPLGNRNGLEDCKLFDVLQKFTTNEDDEIRSRSQLLLKEWSQLKSVYRIPKRKTIETQVPSNARIDHEDDNIEDCSLVQVNKRMRFTSTREFFDPDDDYYEYLSFYADASEIRWKIEYPPVPIIPIAPRAMLGTYDSCGRGASNGELFEYDAQQVHAYPSYATARQVDPWLKCYGDLVDTTPRRTGLHYEASTIDISSRVPDTSSSETTRKLPLNWRSATCENGYVYYYNKITGKSQWDYPEERVSSIEGVSQSQIASLVEKAIMDTERKKRDQTTSRMNSPTSSAASKTIVSPRLSRRSSTEGTSDHALDEAELKKEVGKVVIKYLSAKHTSLWHGDKHLFKELARKITHHIVNRESHSARKIQTMNAAVRAKIEKFIDAHGPEFAAKASRKKKSRASSPVQSSPCIKGIRWARRESITVKGGGSGRFKRPEWVETS
ncbi:histone methyltransferase set2 [Apophysomyces sp. BC1034]|nr:histone methyltransferase set2 [Apophysomyces sp. BC1021]KAG0187025.1 histone methyltransferase set2 [Apophysomyces sp. BC1034]